MSQAIPIALTLFIGVGGAVQTSMLGAIGRERGAAEASWMSILATAVGVTALLAVRAWRGDPPLLPAPFDRAAVHLAVGSFSLAGLVLSMRGLEPYFIITGFFGLAFVFAAAALTPRLGVALFLSAIIAGQLLGALALDQMGAFGSQVHHLNGTRLAGVAVLFAGVILIQRGDN